MTIQDVSPIPRRCSSSDDVAAPLLPTTQETKKLLTTSSTELRLAALDASIEFLLRFSKVKKSRSYGGLMGDSFGKPGKVLLQVAVLVNNIGVLIVYMIIIEDGIHHYGVLEGWFGHHWWNGRLAILIITTLGVFAPLACFKRIDSLRFTSALSVALAVVFLIITAGISIMKFINGGVAMPRLLPDVIVPVLVTAFICHYNDDALDDVLSNFDTDLGIPLGSVLNDAVRVSYALHLMLVFPIVFYPLRINIDGLLFPSVWVASAPVSSLLSLGANCIPSIWDAFQFTGATAAVCLGFIFPASIILNIKQGHDLSCFHGCSCGITNAIAIYSDAYALFKRNAPRE
ncbi:hypothetical protein Bca52824_061285 [Brassica carinata]|uniref:Amino acid transporter transmembrane domain-containing protein n=1 Tax=Brassica carinata TaxID=52824 RepID=A0A8X7UGC4_BRACI|nr:hypothetical protein Bca52824_061285 [Brassica carinata]